MTDPRRWRKKKPMPEVDRGPASDIAVKACACLNSRSYGHDHWLSQDCDSSFAAVTLSAASVSTLSPVMVA